MISKSKNILSKETIEKLVENAFVSGRLKEYKELTEGFFNSAYFVALVDGREAILKVAPQPEVLVMSSEKNIMYTEVETMRLISQKTKIPLPEIYFYDNSHTIIASDYFFMSKLSGKSFQSCMEEFSENEKELIQQQVGKYTAEINGISGSQFGYFGQPDKQGGDWFEVFQTMIMGTISDCATYSLNLGIESQTILDLLNKDKRCFDEVKIPQLVHWDLWAGNVFLVESEVTGLIDFERCIWGDPLLEVGFRGSDKNKGFYLGYGIKELTKEQERRCKWYDVYLFLLVLAECEFRQYESRGMHDWAAKELMTTIQSIQ